MEISSPDPTIDVARMHTIDGYVSVFREAQESVLQLCKPGLEPELVVLIVLKQMSTQTPTTDFLDTYLHAIHTRISFLGIEIGEVEFA